MSLLQLHNPTHTSPSLVFCSPQIILQSHHIQRNHHHIHDTCLPFTSLFLQRQTSPFCTPHTTDVVVPLSGMSLAREERLPCRPYETEEPFARPVETIAVLDIGQGHEHGHGRVEPFWKRGVTPRTLRAAAAPTRAPRMKIRKKGRANHRERTLHRSWVISGSLT